MQSPYAVALHCHALPYAAIAARGRCSAACSRRTTARPLHTTFTKICGASVADAALRPNPTPQGRVELKYNEEWGTVCSAGWSHDAAAKLCQSLGFATGAAYVAAIS